MESIPPVATPLAPRGFTLVEMVVVLAIIVIITAVVLTGQSRFDKSLTITDTAYAVALSVREAQTFGLSSRTYSGNANTAYGVHFAAATPTSYQLFADIYPAAPGAPSAFCPGHGAGAGSPDAKPGNCLYDAAQNERVQNYTFQRNFSIADICGHDPSQGNAQVCTSTGFLTGIDIVFLRPNTDTIVTGIKSLGGDDALSDAQIKLQTPAGGIRYICVTGAGEVSVAVSSCP